MKFVENPLHKKGNLLKHDITHTREKPFSCEHCGKSFAHKYDIFIHQRTHTGEKPFSCDQYGKISNEVLS